MSMRSATENEKWHRYFAKWITISVIVGVVCGLSALALLEAIRIITQLTLSGIAGYSPLLAGGEGGTSGLVLSTVRYFIPIVTALACLAGGLLNYFYVHSAAGVGS